MPKFVKKNAYKGRKFSKSKKDYIEESNTSSSSDSKRDKYANIAFMELQYSDGDKEEKVTNFYPKKRVSKKKTYVTSNFLPTCLYCGIIGHTHNACHARNYNVTSENYVWIKKGTNHEGPKSHWVHRKT